MPARSLRSQLTLALVLATATPVLAVGGVLAARSGAQRERVQAEDLQRTAVAICRAVDEYVERHRAGVTTMAATLSPVAPAPSRELDDRLGAFHALHPGFVTVFATDTTGRMVGAHPVRDAAGQARVGRSVADREYFRLVMAQPSTYAARAFVSQGFIGRGVSPNPVVAVSAPVRAADGRALGTVAGSLDLRAFSRIGEGFEREDGTTFAVVDSAKHVIYSSAALRLPPLAEVRAHPLLAAAHAARAGTTFDYAAADGAQERYLGARCTTVRGWEVLARLPMAQLQRETRQQYAVTLGWAAFVALLSGAVSYVLARRVAQPLRALAGALDAHHVGEELTIPRLGAAPDEVRLVVTHLGAMTARVGAADRELRAALRQSHELRAALEHVVARREEEIDARTAELAAAEARARRGEAQYRLLFDGSPRPAWVYDAHTLRFLSVNAAAVRMYGWSAEEMATLTVADVWPAELRDELRAYAQRVRDDAVATRDGVHVARDGRRIDVTVVSRPLEYEGRAARLVLVEDVTAQRRLEREREEARARAEAGEAKLALAMQTAQMAWWSWTFAETAPVWSPAMGPLYGLPSGWSPPNIEAVRALVHPDDRAEVHAEQMRADRDGDAQFHVEYRALRPDGTVRWLESRADIERDETGAAVRLLGVVRDVTERRLAMDRLAASEQRQRAVFERSPVAMVVADARTRRVTAANAAASALFGYTKEEWRSRGPLGLIAPEAREAFAAAHAGLAIRAGLAEEWPLVSRDGRVFTALVTLEPVRLGEDDAYLIAIQDVTAMRVATRAAAESEARFRGILESLRGVAVCLDLDGRVTYANPYAYEFSGLSAEEVLGAEWLARFVADCAECEPWLRQLIAGDVASSDRELVMPARDGRPRLLAWHALQLRDAHGAAAGVAMLGQDITEQRAEEEALRALSERDPLTGLLNRRGFQAAVDGTLARSGRVGSAQALVAIDLDGFKSINDTYGHATGDEALRQVAAMLQDVVRGSDHAARLGGDEFALYLAELEHESDLTRVVDRLDRVLAAHNVKAALAGCPYRIAWSVGATTRRPGDDLTSMLARADEALYRVKHARPGGANGRSPGAAA